MRIAIAGKGGSGKTTLAGTLARLLARQGPSVIAVDGDTNPNLAQALGISTPAADPGPAALPSDLLVRREEPSGETRTELAYSVAEILRRYGTRGPDGVQLLVMGRVEHAGAGCKCRAHAIARNLLGELLAWNGAEHAVVVDMEAGLEHLSRGTTRHVDTVLAVAEPYFRSLETARRVCELARELGIGRVGMVANKVRDPEDSRAIADYAARHDLPLLAEVPHDEAVLEADRRATPLLDTAAPDTPAVRALDRLARELTRTTGGAA